MDFSNYVTEQIQESIKIKKHVIGNDVGLITKMSKMIVSTYKNKGKVIICGNGGSAADAQHMAAELVNRFEINRRGLPAIALSSNAANLTSISNDYSYDEVFSRQLDALGSKKDILIAISTSGNSKNVLKAVTAAKRIGMKTIGLTGAEGNKLRNCVNVCFKVPSKNTARIQEVHLLVEHLICFIVERSIFGKK